MSKIEITNPNLYYGSFHTLKNVNIAIHEKEITAFIGPGGCGKSTLLKSINRMNDPVEGYKIDGEILLYGVNIFKDLALQLKQDAEAAKATIAADQEVDHKERKIESLCLKLLLQQQPAAKDLRLIAAALKMITDMERIGDPMLLREMFFNLIDNAVKYTPDGGEVSVTVQNTGEQIVCTVSDTGIGIPKERQPMCLNASIGWTRAIPAPQAARGSGLPS